MISKTALIIACVVCIALSGCSQKLPAHVIERADKVCKESGSEIESLLVKSEDTQSGVRCKNSNQYVRIYQ